MIESRPRECVLVALALLLLAQGPPAAQDLSTVYAPLALSLSDDTAVDVLRACGTTHDELAQLGIQTVTPLADGRALRADQFPRFLRPDHADAFGFTDFLVLGDYATVEFHRVNKFQAAGFIAETWTRTHTVSIDGRTVSVFSPSWPASVLQTLLRRDRWGTDSPFVKLGDFVPPGPAAAVAVTPANKVFVYLQMVPSNIPDSTVTRIGDDVQFASHVVNIRMSDFGDSRVNGGDSDMNIRGVATKFYQHFPDTYDILAVASHHTEFADFFGFHRRVRNDVAGIGGALFDNSAEYGSNGRLLAVEGYPPGGFATNRAVMHETAHQWNERSAVWATIDRAGHLPSSHTPLLFPGEVMAGAVLEATRRVALDNGAFVVQRTFPTMVYNPLTMYRMGHLAIVDLPTYQVFADQGQFEPATADAPKVGTSLTGDRIEVSPNDFLAADGQRSGSVTTHLQRALIVVSRTGLISQEEMSVFNFFAKRIGEDANVSSWDLFPSFYELTGGRADMDTDITPKMSAATGAAGTVQTAAKIAPGPPVTCLPVATTALGGVTLESELQGCVSAGTPLTLTGTLTLTDRTDYNSVCFRFLRYGSDDPTESFECASLNGNRFSIPVTLRQAGQYTIEPFAFFPNSGSQFPLAWYFGITVQ